MYSKEIQDFLKKIDYTMEPTSVKKKGNSFIVKWLWDEDGKPTITEDEADEGVIHQYSKDGDLELEAMM